MRKTQTKSDSLQQNSQTISEFVRRTDTLADRTGLNLSDLPQILGFSKPMLFAYRSGKNRITAKVWLKLERAEREVPENRTGAGEDEENAKLETYLNKDQPPEPGKFESSMLREDETPYRFTPMVKVDPHEPPDESLRPVLERIANALEKLVELEQRKKP